HLIESVRRGPSRDNGKVVRDLGVIEDAFGWLDPIFVENGARVRILDPAQCRFYRRDIILRQIARISPRISDHFEAFVKLLRDLQGALRTEAASVCIALQTGQVVKERRRLGCWLSLFGCDTGFADTSVFAF